MRSDEKKNIMPDAIGYIDDDIVSGVLYKIDKDSKTAYRRRRRKASTLAAAAFAIAACVLLLILTIPRTETMIKYFNAIPPASPADSSDGTEPEYDGSRGLLYEINENGTSASFIGFGNCTDRIVRIASTYDGLPVTVMYDKYNEYLEFVPYDQSDLWHIKQIVISDTVKYVDSKFFSKCPNIESVYIGASVENIDTFHFSTGYGVKFAQVEVSPDNPYYSGKGNCVVDLRSKALVFATYKAVIPDDGSVEIIGSRAFSPAKYWLCSIAIPEGVKIIDHDAFGDCYKLENVILPDSLEVIEADAFATCKNLKKLEIGTNLKAVDVTVFYSIKPPVVYYKGTVAQWEAVVKTNTINRNAVSVIISSNGVETKTTTEIEYTPYAFTVCCTDGESNSEVGVHGDYGWREFPEYIEYMNRESESFTHYVFNSDGTTTKIYPWDKYVKE